VTRVDRTWQASGLLLLLVLLFYPTLFFGRVLSLQSPLWAIPPWSELGGPNPMDRPHLQEAALTLAPRLALIQRYRWELAIWNPFVGGGRVGFLAMAADGYGPLAVVAGLFAKEPYLANTLLLLHVCLAFLGTYLLARRQLSPPAAVLTGVVYVLSGPVISSWCAGPGSAAAFGPWLWFSVLSGKLSLAALTAAMLVASGSESWGFLAGFVLLSLVSPQGTTLPRRVVRLSRTVLAAVALAAPSLALGLFGSETPRLWWLEGSPQSAPNLASLLTTSDHPSQQGLWVFLGAPVLMLALLGCALPGLVRNLGLGVALASATLVFTPASALSPFLAAHRPTATLACGFALLAGAGLEVLFSRSWQIPKGVLGTAAMVVTFAHMLPAAALWLSWETRGRATLPQPETPASPAAYEPVLPLLALPPDSPALLELADLRARTLVGEPKYRTLLAPGPGGVVAFSRITDPQLAALGVSWLWEPQEVTVVSGELFARLELGETARDPERPIYPVTVPEKATRLGLRVARPPGFLFLERDGQRWVLVEDRALAGESELWHFFLLPRECPPGASRLVSDREFARRHPRLVLGWDTSGWELAGEREGARLWLKRDAVPLAGWKDPRSGAPAPKLLAWQPQGASVEVETTLDQELVLRMKFRPHLLRVLLDGKPQPSHSVAPVWTGVTVPPGRHRLEVRYALPTVAWLAPFFGLVFLISPRKEQP